MEERRKISRVSFSANSVIVDANTQEKFFGKVKNVSPMGIAIEVRNETPSLLSREVIIVAETLIMYADVVREDEGKDSRVVAFSAKKFTPDVLEYLFEHISAEV